uniref:N-acetyllactosaminide beta-1,3-N-acetylglucosaminyltransferase n=1 Tax=Parastrongyloides trichosuri TaxID=131310 RepID=A0A0N4ZE03_PARTI
MISSYILTFIFNFILLLNLASSQDDVYVEILEDKTLISQKYKNYCVIYNFWNGTMNIDEVNDPRISLVLHSTVNYIPYLENHINTWEGPISIAIVVPPPIDSFCENCTTYYSEKNLIIFKILHLFSKFNDISKISLHLFYINNKKNCPKIDKPSFDMSNQSKDEIDTLIKDAKNMDKYFDVYPINVARNLARKGMKTRLFLSSDVEQICNNGYESRMRKLAKKEIIDKKRNIVLVHRRFEMDENETIPKNKKELKALYDKKKAIVFHELIYKDGHSIPRLNEWFNIKEDFNQTTISQVLPYLRPGWEPQFVGGENVPFHDENFPYRIRSNTHLPHILCYRDFKFGIVNDLFTIHKGIQKEFKKHKSITKEVIRRAYFYGQKFNSKLRKKYPKNAKKCKPLVVFKG